MLLINKGAAPTSHAHYDHLTIERGRDTNYPAQVATQVKKTDSSGGIAWRPTAFTAKHRSMMIARRDAHPVRPAITLSAGMKMVGVPNSVAIQRLKYLPK